jgi:hypothetical protein
MKVGIPTSEFQSSGYFQSTVLRLLWATSTANSRRAEEVRNCLTDAGRSLGTGLQEQVPNHLRRLWLKAKVVNAEGKGSEFTGSVDRQEEDRKGTADEVSKRNRRSAKPQPYNYCGTSSDHTCLRAERHPACEVA